MSVGFSASKLAACSLGSWQPAVVNAAPQPLQAGTASKRIAPNGNGHATCAALSTTTASSRDLSSLRQRSASVGARPVDVTPGAFTCRQPDNFSGDANPKPAREARSLTVRTRAVKVEPSELQGSRGDEDPSSPLSPSWEQAATAPECMEVAGRARLQGHVHISGAKNSALALMAGALLCSEAVVLHNVPNLKDCHRMGRALQSVGAKFQFGADGTPDSLLIDSSNLTSAEPRADAVRKLRASFFVIGSLLARMGEAVVPLPGGCNIGARPIDLHIRGLQALGAEVSISQGKVHAKASKLVGARIYMDYPSVGATETLMMAACLAEGETTISNVAQEPEVVDLANLLNAMGARITGAGTNCISITGVKRLHGCHYDIIPDRIEAGTFLVAGAITNSTLTLAPVIPRHLTAVIAKLHAVGCKLVLEKPDQLRIIPARRLMPVDITTLPYPGFPTDMQSQFMSLLLHADGVSTVRETVFESRLRHAEELQRLGGNLKLNGNCVTITGQPGGGSLWGGPVMATDLRAGAALILAGLSAEGVTTVEGMHHVDRGYENIDKKLRAIGADVRRVPSARLVD
eukprot:jgi/Mesvir1/16281/Mv08523-RA.1